VPAPSSVFPLAEKVGSKFLHQHCLLAVVLVTAIWVMYEAVRHYGMGVDFCGG